MNITKTTSHIHETLPFLVKTKGFRFYENYIFHLTKKVESYGYGNIFHPGSSILLLFLSLHHRCVVTGLFTGHILQQICNCTFYHDHVTPQFSK